MTKVKHEVRSPTYRNCERIMKYAKKHGRQGQKFSKTVVLAIKIVVGSDPRTVNRYKKALAEFGFVKVK